MWHLFTFPQNREVVFCKITIYEALLFTYKNILCKNIINGILRKHCLGMKYFWKWLMLIFFFAAMAGSFGNGRIIKKYERNGYASVKFERWNIWKIIRERLFESLFSRKNIVIFHEVFVLSRQYFIEHACSIPSINLRNV